MFRLDISLYRIKLLLYGYLILWWLCFSSCVYCCSVINVRPMHPLEAQCKLNIQTPPPTPNPPHPTQDFHVYVHVPSVRQWDPIDISSFHFAINKLLKSKQQQSEGEEKPQAYNWCNSFSDCSELIRKFEMNCIGNLPKKIVLNELNFLVTVILLKTGDCILSFRCIRLLSEFPCSYVVQRIRWIFLFSMLSVLFVCL